MEAEATPIQASIAELFEEKATWMVESLAARLGLKDFGLIKNSLAFWAGLGLLKSETGGWRLLEHAEEGGNTAVPTSESMGTPIELEESLAIVNTH